MADFFDVVLGQRAHRALRPDPVPDELIARVLDAAVHAPSAENRQPWAFVVVRDPSLRHAIARMTAATWEAGAGEYSRPNLTPRMFDEVDRWAREGLASAPVHVVVGGDTSLAAEALLPSSVYPAVQNLLLAALAVGLGSLMSTLSIVSGQAFRELLELPDHIVPLALVPLGYPARPLGPPRRQPFAAKTFRDRWGQPW
ncbi:MAG TPA: nitroreductase family protein [Acidimicrobiales bacterium]